MSMWHNSHQWNARVGLQGMKFWESYFLSLFRSYWQGCFFPSGQRDLTMSPGTSTAILPPWGWTDIMEEWQRERKKLDGWCHVELLFHTHNAVHPIPELCRYKSQLVISCAVGAPLSWVLWWSQPQRIQNDKWEKALIHSFLPMCLDFTWHCFLTVSSGFVLVFSLKCNRFLRHTFKNSWVALGKSLDFPGSSQL